MMQRPGNVEVQLKFFREYLTNVELYPDVQGWLRDTSVPVLAVWGRNDQIFGPACAEAFRRDSPRAVVELLEGGHFLLETHAEEVAALIHRFLLGVWPL
jgi:pimeloyl-ACP methyl ester carboxylesterase